MFPIIDPTREYCTGDLARKDNEMLVFDGNKWLVIGSEATEAYDLAETQMNEELAKKGLPCIEDLLKIARESKPEYFV